MNHNIPEFKALVRRSWFTKDNANSNISDLVSVFGFRLIKNEI